MPIELPHVPVPVVVVRGPQLLERVEHRELHVRVDPVDEGDPAVAQVEDHRVLVVLPIRSDHAARVAVEREAAVGVDEPVDAHLPGPVRLGLGQVRVGHHHLLAVAAAHALDARVLVAGNTLRRAARQHLLELVAQSVPRGEHQHVGDVVEEAGSGSAIARVAVAHATGEEVERAVVMDRARVEDRAVAGDRSRRDDRRVADAPHRDCGGARRLVVEVGHGLAIATVIDGRRMMYRAGTRR